MSSAVLESAEEEVLVRGDMRGDRPLIGDSHRLRAEALFALLRELPKKSVLAIGGPSGSGKSEIASLLGSSFIRHGRPAYVLSCDNYPWRPPRANDQHREDLFKEGERAALVGYLGTKNEIDFNRIGEIVNQFKQGVASIPLRIMDTTEHYVFNDRLLVDFGGIDILLLEGTWSCTVANTTRRVFLETNFTETIEHRRKRARDPITPFGELVLGIEQEKLNAISKQCDFIIDMQANIRKANT
ncbi:MAG: hypothetical protein QY326_02965 [Bdellovibrionota bacterium]|nr:MAG: hypothetical protein QY326_02965 [Bdellovibrionota bacterium]